MQIIAISGKRRSGKSTLGNILRDEYGYFPISLAEPLKALAKEHFGLTADQTDGVFKEQPTQYMDQWSKRHLTPRDILIRMGQFYRSINPDFWTAKLFEQVKQAPQAQMKTFVVTDVRFKNEMEWMRRHKALCVRLDRFETFTGTNIADPSETELDDYSGWDIHIKAEENKDMSDMARIGDMVNAHILARA